MDVAMLAPTALSIKVHKESKLRGWKSRSGISIDLIPFGGVSDNDEEIHWPPDDDTVMTVLGFREACAHAELVKLRSQPELIVPVASPEGFALLKLISWSERDATTRVKDAQDILYAIHHYLKVS